MFGRHMEFVFSGDADDAMMAEETLDAGDAMPSLSVYRVLGEEEDERGTIEIVGRNLQRMWDFGRQWVAHATVDLKTLIKREGLPSVATVVGCSMSTLARKRAAIRPVHETEHVRLKHRWPDYDLKGTVMRNGKKRLSKGLL